MAWLNIVLSTLEGLGTTIRGTTPRHIPIVNAFRPLTSPLISAVFLAFFALGQAQLNTSELSVRLGSSTAQLTADPAATTTGSEPGPPSTGLPAGTPDLYTVMPGDTLWSIAAAQLENPLEWRAIFLLNEGRPQPDGRTLSDPGWIYPGWQLVLPSAQATLQESMPAPPADPSQQTGPNAPATNAPPSHDSHSTTVRRKGTLIGGSASSSPCRGGGRSCGSCSNRGKANCPIGVLGPVEDRVVVVEQW